MLSSHQNLAYLLSSYVSSATFFYFFHSCTPFFPSSLAQGGAPQRGGLHRGLPVATKVRRDGFRPVISFLFLMRTSYFQQQQKNERKKTGENGSSSELRHRKWAGCKMVVVLVVRGKTLTCFQFYWGSG